MTPNNFSIDFVEASICCHLFTLFFLFMIDVGNPETVLSGVAMAGMKEYTFTRRSCSETNPKQHAGLGQSYG
jgi:hypothetical protein